MKATEPSTRSAIIVGRLASASPDELVRVVTPVVEHDLFGHWVLAESDREPSGFERQQ